MTKNLLLLTYYFPPADTIGAQRFGKMCRYMPEFGWTPYVICPHAAGNTVHGLPEDQVIRVGVQSPVDQRIKDMTSAGPAASLLYRLGKRLRFDARAFDGSVVTWARAVRRAWPSLFERLPRIDCVLSSYGPSGPHWLGRRLGRRLAVPWIADYRDPCSLYPMDRGRWVRRFDRLVERFLLRRADSFVIVTETWQSMMREAFGLVGTTVFNGWDPDEVPQPVETRGDYLYYGGRLYANQIASLRVLLRALSETPEQRLVFLSMGPHELERDLRDEVARLGLATRVEIRPGLEPEAAARIAAGARATIVFQDLTCTDAWARGWLPGKLMQQIGLKPPILCIAHPGSEIGSVLARTGKGRLCATVGEVCGFLEETARDPSAYGGDAEGIATYARRSQAGALCRFLDTRTAAVGERS